MFLSDISIKRPVFGIMMTVTVLLFGFVGLGRLGIDLFPEVDIPIVTVTTTWQGAAPETMDADVTDPIEEELVSIEGVKHITSYSSEGVSQVITEFVLEKDVDVAAQEVRDKVSEAMDKLPRDIDPPVIDKMDVNAKPVVWVALTGKNISIQDLGEYADDILKPRFQTISGVGNIEMAGYQEREMRIWLNARKLEAYGLTASDVKRVIRAKNVEFPGGWLEGKDREFTVKTRGELLSEEDFNRLIIAFRSGAPVRLKDIGYAEDGLEPRRSLARFNRVPSVCLGIAKRTGGNKVAIAKAVKLRLKELKEALPAGMNLEIAHDDSKYTEHAIRDVKVELFGGGLFATLVVFLFLRSVGSTFITAISIPTSIIGAFSIMYFLNFTINNLTMLALTLCTGMVIDDAIIVIENIYRHVEEGEDRVTAARSGAHEIAFAAMAATFSIVGVFVPVAFMGGVIGRFFYQFGITVAATIMLSLFIALTLIPLLSAQFLQRTTSHGRLFELSEKMFKNLEYHYRKMLNLCLQKRWWVVTIGAGVLIFSLFLGMLIDKEFVPKQDQSMYLIHMETTIGSSIDYTDQKLRLIEKIVTTHPATKRYTALIGFGDRKEVHKGMVFVTMVPKSKREQSQYEVMDYLRERLSKIPGVKVFVEEIDKVGGGASGERSTAVSFNIMGMDVQKVSEISQKVISDMKKVPKIVDVDDNLELEKPEARIHIDRDKAGDLGVEVREIASTVYALIAGERLYDTKFKDVKKGKRYDIRVRLIPSDRDEPDSINYLMVRTSSGEMVRLSNLVDIEETVGPNIINRRDRQKTVTIYADTQKGMTSDTALTFGMESAKKYFPDKTYSLAPVGRSEQMQESFEYLGFAFIMAIVITYIILASQFNSFIHPFTIMIALPLSMVGALGALLLVGSNLNIMSIIGIIMLVGIVTKNSILLVDFTNTLREQGLSKDEALLKASPIRLRPILMTALSTIAAVIPTALALGEGNEIRQPMAIAVGGGMTTSTLLTLFIVPICYSLFDDLAVKMKVFFKRVFHRSG